MKLLKWAPLLLLVAGFTFSTLGCGPAAPPSETEKKELESQMEQDMQDMQGMLPKTPGEGQPAPAGEQK